MKKIISFAITLIILLCFGAISVKAQTAIVTNLDEYKEAMLYNSSTVTEIKLGADINISSLTLDTIPIYMDRTFDLNGHKITTQMGKILPTFNGNYTFTIKDSSVAKTGLIYTNGNSNYSYPILIDKYVGATVTSAKVVLEGITFNGYNQTHVIRYFKGFDEDDNKIEINNVTFKNTTEIIKRYEGTEAVKMNIKSMTGINVRYINQNYNYRVSDIIDPSSELIINGSAMEPGTLISDYSVIAGFKVKPKERFDVDDIKFDSIQYGYSNISAKPITIKSVGSLSKQIKSINTISDNFVVLGNTKPIIAAGNIDNTSFSIKPVNNLRTGTYSDTIIVTDMDDNLYRANITFTVLPASITPEVSIAGWSYGETANLPIVFGNIGNGTVIFKYKIKDAPDSTYSTTIPTNAGEYTVAANISSSTNYNRGYATTNFSINKSLYNEEISYIKNVREKGVNTYCISLSDLDLPSELTNVKMVSYVINTNTNNIFNNLEVKSLLDQFCITTNSVDANKTDIVDLKISSDNYIDKLVSITVNTIPKETIIIDGLTYNNKEYDKNPIVPTGELIHTGYTGTIDILYESTDGKGYSSETVPTNAGDYKVTYSIPNDNKDYTGSKVYIFSIEKARPIFTIPNGLKGVTEEQLSTVTLPTEFTWNNKTTILTAGNQTYIGTFTPDDTDNYNTITNVSIPVYVKNKYTISTNVNGGNGTISTSATVIEGTDHVITFTPADGYMIDTVKENDVSLVVTSKTYTIFGITGNKNIVVTYKKIPFTITVNEVTGAIITPNGTINVLYGDNKEITITSKLGYRLKSVKVNNEEKLPLTENRIIITNIIEDQKVIVTVEKIKYNVTNGEGQKHMIGKNEDAIFKIGADKNLFLDVYINDEKLDSAFYTITEGSTIITLNQDFLNDLLPNTYNLRATFSDGGEANTTFVIAQPAENNPKTGDSVIISIIIGIVSLIGLLGIGIYFKKNLIKII